MTYPNEYRPKADRADFCRDLTNLCRTYGITLYGIDKSPIYADHFDDSKLIEYGVHKGVLMSRISPKGEWIVA